MNFIMERANHSIFAMTFEHMASKLEKIAHLFQVSSIYILAIRSNRRQETVSGSKTLDHYFLIQLMQRCLLALYKHIPNSIKVALGIGNCALGSYCLVVTQALALCSYAQCPIANDQLPKQPLLNQVYSDRST